MAGEEQVQVKSIEQIDAIQPIIDDGGIRVITGVNDLPSNGEEFNRIKETAMGNDSNTQQQQQSSQGDYKPMPTWDFMKEEFIAAGLEFELPEALKTGKINDKPLTPKEEYELMREMIIENTDFGFDQDPVISHYLKSKEKNPNLNPNDFINEYQASMQIHSMEDKDFLIAYMRSAEGQSDINPNGLTEEQIQERVGKLHPEQLKAESKKYKETVLQNFYEGQQEIRKNQQQKLETELKRQDVVQKQILETTVNTIKSKKGFDDIIIDDESLGKINTTFVDVFTRNESNPLVNVNIPKKFVDMLTHENLYKIVAYLNNPDIIKKQSDEKIKSLEEQLGVRPSKGATQLGRGSLQPV